MSDERMFPIMTNYYRKQDVVAHPPKIPWSIAELAYSVYVNKYGRCQTLERLAERGGFSADEMDDFLPDWRDRCSALAARDAELAALRKQVEVLKASRKAWFDTAHASHQTVMSTTLGYRTESEHQVLESFADRVSASIAELITKTQPTDAACRAAGVEVED